MFKARKMLAEKCEGFLTNIVDKTQESKLRPKDILIIRNVVEEFLEVLLELTLKREISFEIELIPSSTSVSKASYKNGPS